MSAHDMRNAALDTAETAGGAAPGEAAATPPSDRVAIWAQLLAVDVAFGLLWALLLAAAVLFIGGVSQFIYIAF